MSDKGAVGRSTRIIPSGSSTAPFDKTNRLNTLIGINVFGIIHHAQTTPPTLGAGTGGGISIYSKA